MNISKGVCKKQWNPNPNDEGEHKAAEIRRENVWQSRTLQQNNEEHEGADRQPEHRRAQRVDGRREGQGHYDRTFRNRPLAQCGRGDDRIPCGTPVDQGLMRIEP